MSDTSLVLPADYLLRSNARGGVCRQRRSPFYGVPIQSRLRQTAVAAEDRAAASVGPADDDLLGALVPVAGPVLAAVAEVHWRWRCGASGEAVS